jgi:hypothetical protein
VAGSSRQLQAAALEKQIAKLSEAEARELLILTMYKLALTRAQLDALTDLLVKKKLVKREDVWRLTAEKFGEHGF